MPQFSVLYNNTFHLVNNTVKKCLKTLFDNGYVFFVFITCEQFIFTYTVLMFITENDLVLPYVMFTIEAF